MALPGNAFCALAALHVPVAKRIATSSDRDRDKQLAKALRNAAKFSS
jgi:hypothetical protein